MKRSFIILFERRRRRGEYISIDESPSAKQEDVRNEPKVKAREGLETLRFYELPDAERVVVSG